MMPREKAAVDKYESLGYDVIKKGIPDLILLKDGKISFVEVKSGEGYLSENQQETISLLRKHGFKVDVRVFDYITPDLIIDRGESKRLAAG